MVSKTPQIEGFESSVLNDKQYSSKARKTRENAQRYYDMVTAMDDFYNILTKTASM